MALGHAPEGLKVFILAPLGRDARLAAEALGSAAGCAGLSEWLQGQETWSDLPIVALGAGWGRVGL